MQRLLAWLTDAGLADSIIGDLEEGRRTKGQFWFWTTLAGIVGHAAWRRTSEHATRGGLVGAGGDLRHAIRVLRRRPGFAFCTILLLALGIGANTAVFSIVRGVLLRPLPYADPNSLVFIWSGLDTAPGNRHDILTGRYVISVHDRATTLASVAIVKGWQTGLDGQIDLILPDGAERLRGAIVTPNFFELLGARAPLGRTFSSSDGEAPLAVISDNLWRRRFAGDPRIIGHRAAFSSGRGARNSGSYTIVGVLPPDFRYSYPRETEVYLLLPWSTVRPSRAVEYQMVARLKPGVTPGQAQAELAPIARDIVRAYGWTGPEAEEAVKRAAMMVEPVSDHLQAEVRPGIMLLAAVAGLVLIIACVNLGLLLLARTVDRRGELGLRAALGAGSGRIVRQLMAECAVLALSGGTLGVLVAEATQPLLRSLMPPIAPRIDQIGIDPVVICFAAALMVVTAIVCGVGPAWFVLRGDLLNAVRGAAKATTGDPAVMTWRRAIVATQVAVVALLLVGSGLLLRSFWRLQHVDVGFRADNVVTMEIRLLNPKYRERGRVAAFNDDVLTAVRAIPGVANASLTTAVPMRGVDFLTLIGPKVGKRQLGNKRSVDPEYFSVMHVPLKAGRLLTEHDTAESEPVMVVSESYGQRHFGSDSPLGRTLFHGREIRIVGVVGDVRYADVSREPAPAFYVPRTQDPSELICLVVEPRPGMQVGVIGGIRSTVRVLDPEQPVEGITTIKEIVSASTADRRFYAVSTGAFASVAVLLAVAGIFGVVSRTVNERRREIAIRVALGADPKRLARLVYGYGLFPAAAGTIAGLACAFAGSRLLQKFLFETAPTDAATYAGTAALVLTVTVAACYLPARRTLRVQPMVALKSD